jgi:hypothetical protein
MQSTRRGLFSLFAAPAVALAAPTIAAALPEPTGPIEPIDFIDQQLAIGDRLVAGVLRGKPCGGYIEYFADFGPEAYAVRCRLNQRAHRSGPDFSKRVAAELFARGLTEDLIRPQVLREVAS